MDDRFPRIPVTPSMLCSYALLRGKGNHVAERQGDPVHHALFPVLHRTFEAGPVVIPMLQERGSEEE